MKTKITKHLNFVSTLFDKWTFFFELVWNKREFGIVFENNFIRIKNVLKKIPNRAFICNFVVFLGSCIPVWFNWPIKFCKDCRIWKFIIQSLPWIMESGHWGSVEKFMTRKIQEAANFRMTLRCRESPLLTFPIDAFTI